MPSFFSIVRYVPDPVTDERLNIGVIVFGDGQVLSKFIGGWGKVKIFGGEDISFLRQFADDIERKQLDLYSDDGRWDDNSLQRISKHWKNSIQLSEPKASLEPPQKLLSDISDRYIREQVRQLRERKDKREAVRLGLNALAQSYLNTHSEPLPIELIKRNHRIAGFRDEHTLDLVIGNGHPCFAAEALSFQGHLTNDMKTEVDAALWVMEDLRKANKRLPLTVLALPPEGRLQLFMRAKKIFTRDLKVEFVTTPKVQTWGRKMARAIAVPAAIPLSGMLSYRGTKRIRGISTKITKS